MSGVDYKSSGVDIGRGDALVNDITTVVESTFSPQVMSRLGGFAGLYDLSQLMETYENPVMVQSIDGVGTKSMVAGLMDDYSTLGQCLVSATVNDILVCGAKPLTLLDYVASDRLNQRHVYQLINSIAENCLVHGISLVGGETAEMPGTYIQGEHDVVGVITGVVEKSDIVDGRDIQAGDKLIGLTSSGLHTNGYSLARHVCFRLLNLTVDTYVEELSETVGNALLKPHTNYMSAVFACRDEEILIKGMAHITGGGLPGNLGRILPGGLSMFIETKSWPSLAIFSFLQAAAKISVDEMYRAFNMGIGYVMVVPEAMVNKTMSVLNKLDAIDAYVIGDVKEGAAGVNLV